MSKPDTFFDFQAVRHAYRDLCDVPPCDRTPEQVDEHARLGSTVGAMKSIVAKADVLKAITKGKLIPVVFADPGDPTCMGDVAIVLGATNVPVHRFHYTSALPILEGMAVAAEVAR